jgi:hypothetical protein
MKKIILIVALILSSNSFAKEEKCDLIYNNKKFSSTKLKSASSKECAFELKAGKRNRLIVCNESDSIAEFESHDLKLEKIIPAKKSGVVMFRALEAGKKYRFEEEFSQTDCNFIAK